MLVAFVAVTCVIGSGMLIISALVDLRAARQERDSADAQLALARGMADEITTLAARAPTASLGRRPTPGVVAQVGDALVLAGVPIDALASLDSDENTSDGSGATATGDGMRNAAPGLRPHLRRQFSRLTLEPLSMPQFARFLDAWRANRPEWTITSIQITPQDGGTRPNARARGARTSAAGAQANAAPPLRVHLVMESAYVDEGPATTPGPPDGTDTGTEPPE